MNLKHRSDLSVRVVDDETIILDQHAGQVHTLNQTAAYIWSQCNGERSEVEIAALLAEFFDVDPHIAEQDTIKVISQLQDLGLLIDSPL